MEQKDQSHYQVLDLENLEFYRKLFDVDTKDPLGLLKIAGLDHVGKKKAEEFSKGMKHRLTFVRSMLNNPEIWFLDEPTTGLDPAIASQIKDIIKDGSTKFYLNLNRNSEDLTQGDVFRRRIGPLVSRCQFLPVDRQNRHANEQAHASGNKCHIETVHITQWCRQKGRSRCADIDTHVENIEPGVASGITRAV